MESINQDPEDIILEWCASEDFHSGGMVYEETRPTEEADTSSQSDEESDPEAGERDSLAPAPVFPSQVNPRGRKQKGGPKAMDRSPIEIDPMDPVTLGSAQVKRAHANLKVQGYRCPSETLEPLLWPKAFYERCVLIGPKPKPSHRRDTRVPQKNARDLHDWGLLTAIALGLIVCFAQLFTVPKPSGLHRVIIDGRPGNMQLARPPYFKFFQPTELVGALRRLGRFTGCSMDIRHFFYRLALPSYIGVFYGLMLVTGLFIPTQVPMGSTHGPAWASSFAFCVVAFREAHESTLGLRVPPDIIPTVLDIFMEGVLVGHIWIVIDNILVVTTIPALTQQWRERLNRNGKHLGIWPWKEQFNWDQNHLEFTGIVYEQERWRHGEDRIERWKDRHGDKGILSPPVERKTRANSQKKVISQATQTIQRMVGVLVWNCRLRGQHMRNLRHCFKVQTQSIAGHATTREEWTVINEQWKAHIQNEWSEWDDAAQWPPSHAGRHIRVLVTDASDTKWSWLELVAGRVKESAAGTEENPSGYFDQTMREWKIYYKELVTIVIMLQSLDADGVTDIDIVLVGDSKAVIGSLRKMMGPEQAWDMLDVVWHLVRKNRWGLKFVWVESAGNVAHSATHDEAIEEYRVQRSWLLATSEGYQIERPFPKRRRDEK